jgi:hypothetical protein
MPNISDFEDAFALARAYPDTFEAVPAAETARLMAGDCVKVCRNDERFWVLIHTNADGRISGEVNNELVDPRNADIPCGTIVGLEYRHVYQTYRTPKERR